jgi:hypothetical protein
MMGICLHPVALPGAAVFIRWFKPHEMSRHERMTLICSTIHVPMRTYPIFNLLSYILNLIGWSHHV